jgi:hypothetical protein
LETPPAIHRRIAREHIRLASNHFSPGHPVMPWHLYSTLYKTYRIPEKGHSDAGRPDSIGAVPSRQQPEGGLWAPACAGATEEISLASATDSTWACLWLGHAAENFCTAPTSRSDNIQKVSGHALTAFRFPCSTQYECTKSSFIPLAKNIPWKLGCPRLDLPSASPYNFLNRGKPFGGADGL